MHPEALKVAFAIYGAVVLVIGLFAQRAFNSRIRFYYERRCAGKLWRERFPGVDKREIKEFLDLFVNSFGLDSQKKLTFSPDDSIMTIYRVIYPKPGGVDGLECESFVVRCKKHYSVDLVSKWSDTLTLGQIFGVLHKDA
jgi:propanediol dehydratase small subunit